MRTPHSAPDIYHNPVGEACTLTLQAYSLRQSCMSAMALPGTVIASFSTDVHVNYRSARCAPSEADAPIIQCRILRGRFAHRPLAKQAIKASLHSRILGPTAVTLCLHLYRSHMPVHSALSSAQHSS